MDQPLVLKKNSADKFDQVKNVAESRYQARRSHSTTLGTVYILPVSNMPCLVPNKNNAPMPVDRSSESLLNSIPDTIPPRRIILKNE